MAALEGCAQCGCTDPDVLVWHHLRDKKFTVTTGCRTWENRLNELQKCVPLCGSCHTREHRVPPKKLSEIFNGINCSRMGLYSQRSSNEG
jgi:hypothetical protein